jgi:hypothetical protein
MLPVRCGNVDWSFPASPRLRRVHAAIHGSQIVYSELRYIHGRTIYLDVPKSDNCNGEFSYQEVVEGMMFGIRSKFFLAVAGCLFVVSGLRADDLGLGFVDCGIHSDPIEVNVKASAATPVVAIVTCGERFTVLLRGNVLSRIQTKNGKIGFIYTYLITRDDSAPDPLATATPPTKRAPAAAPVATQASSESEENEKITPVDPASAARILSGALTLPDATPVKLKLTRTISSADAHPDDHIEFTVLDDVIVNGVLLIPRGAKAFGTVTQVEPKKSTMRSGKLDLNIDYARLADNEKAELRAVKVVNSTPTSGVGASNYAAASNDLAPSKNVAPSKNTPAPNIAVVSDTLIPWPAAPSFSVMHARDVTIPEGTEITVYTNGDIRLDPIKFGAKVTVAEESQAGSTQPAASSQTMATSQTAPASQPVVPTSAIPSAVSTLATVAFRASPEGAEIVIDGKYVGDAPSTLNLTAGDHVLAIKKAGYVEWQRKITVASGSSLTINPTLTKLR